MLRAMNMAEPQELVPTACFTPMCSAKAFSKFAVMEATFVFG